MVKVVPMDKMIATAVEFLERRIGAKMDAVVILKTWIPFVMRAGICCEVVGASKGRAFAALMLLDHRSRWILFGDYFVDAIRMADLPPENGIDPLTIVGVSGELLALPESATHHAPLRDGGNPDLFLIKPDCLRCWHVDQMTDTDQVTVAARRLSQLVEEHVGKWLTLTENDRVV